MSEKRVLLQQLDRKRVMVQREIDEEEHGAENAALQRWQTRLRPFALTRKCPSGKPCGHRYHLTIYTGSEEAGFSHGGPKFDQGPTPWTYTLYNENGYTPASTLHYAADERSDLLPESAHDFELIRRVGICGSVYRGDLTGLGDDIQMIVDDLTSTLPQLPARPRTYRLSEARVTSDISNTLKRIIGVLQEESLDEYCGRSRDALKRIHQVDLQKL